MQLLIASLSGLGLVLAFLPLALGQMAIVALIPLALLWQSSSPRAAFYQGFAFGFSFFAAGFSWIFVGIVRFAELAWPLAVLIGLLLITLLAVITALQGFVVASISRRVNKGFAAFAFAASFVLQDWLRSHLLTGLPWLLLAHSQVDGPLAGLIPVIGPQLTTFLLAFSAALAGFALQKPKFAVMGLVYFAVLFTASNTLYQKNWTQPGKAHLRYALLQGNIEQPVHWSQSYAINTINQYGELISDSEAAKLVVLPETALPLPKSYAEYYLTAITRLAQSRQQTVLVGLPIEAETPGYYNGLLALGDQAYQYHKQHLVPFGEYYPLAKWHWLDWLGDPFGHYLAGQTNKLLTVSGVRIAPFLCYEIAFNQQVQAKAATADLLLTSSDDAWFGHSLALNQHLQIARFQSLLSGKPQLVLGNTGITAAIDSKGRVVKSLESFQQARLVGDIHAYHGATPYSRLVYS